MSTITQISTQIGVILGAMDEIDQVSLADYNPPLQTRSVALVIPPFGLSGQVAAPVGLKTRLTSRIPCEMWIKMRSGPEHLDESMQLGRDICLAAAAELQATATQGSALNGTVKHFGDEEGNNPFEWRVEDNPIQVGNATYIRGLLFVTVTDWVVLTP